MIITLIAAMGQRREIGVNNQLPWHLPADLRHFKALTTGKTVLMGRKTYQSIGKPLPNRHNVVLTRDGNFPAPGCDVVTSIEAALALAEEKGVEELMVMGGANLYEQMLPRAHRLELTQVDTTVEKADAFFPEWDSAEWAVKTESAYPADDKNEFSYRFLRLQRTVSLRDD